MKKHKPVKKLDENHFRVAVFGSARIKMNDPTYKQINTLAKMIASENMDIVTGGGPGLMEAANSGHKAGRKNNHVHSFGLNITLPKAQRVNMHLDVRREFKHFSERLDQFMLLSNAVVVAPGGIGTMLEFFYTLQLAQVEHICEIPIILLGDMWEDLLDWIKNKPLKRKFLNKEDLNNVFFAKNSKEAFHIIEQAHERFNKGEKNICLNIKKYKIH